jgi:hypothetical protein
LLKLTKYCRSLATQQSLAQEISEDRNSLQRGAWAQSIDQGESTKDTTAWAVAKRQVMA